MVPDPAPTPCPPDAAAQIAALERQLATERAARLLAEQRCREIEALQGRMLNALPDSFWFKDAGQRYRLVNSAFYAFHHLPPGIAIGLRADEVFPPPLAELIRQGDEQAIATGSLFRRESHVTTAGGERWFETIKRAVYDDAGQLLGTVGMNRDITALRRAEAERSALERTLQEAQRQESLGVLAGGIAHDFNNLLTSILGYAQLAILDLPPGSPISESLEHIVAGAQHAAKLASQLLSYAGRGRFLIQPTSLNTLIHELAELIHVSLPRSVTLQSELAAGLPLVAGDVAQLQQVLLNLLTNAAESFAGDTGTVALRTSARSMGAGELRALVPGADLAAGLYVQIEVQDSGVGMDAATLARIFEPFFSTKRTGRGLGLAAVQGIVRSHRGGLRVSSAAGEGTLFQIWLPAHAATAEAPGPAAAPRRYQGAVLVIDDEPSVREVVCQMLHTLGLSTYAAADGQSGLALVQERGGELMAVLLDLTMPGMDGIATARAIGAQQPQLPIVLMSGYRSEQPDQDDPSLRPAGFLPKPFNLETLRAALDRALRAGDGLG